MLLKYCCNFFTFCEEVLSKYSFTCCYITRHSKNQTRLTCVLKFDCNWTGTIKACSHEERYLGGQGYLGPPRYPGAHVFLCFESLSVRMKPRYLAWTTRVTRLTGTTIIHVNALHRDISGGRNNFDCNAHDQYSHMEANMAVMWTRTICKKKSI